MARLVYLIDDDEAVRKALALVLRSVQLQVETFDSAESFLAGYQPNAEDRSCVITDVRMPGMSGLQLQNELMRRKFDVPIIIISAHADVRQAVRAMQSGALSVLEKPVDEQELIDVINRTLDAPPPGRSASHRAAIDGYRRKLTQRQCEVFDLLLRGLQTKEVARQLNLSYRTVEVHRANILERLKLSSFTLLFQQLLSSAEPEQSVIRGHSD